MDKFWVERRESGIDNKKALLIFPHWGASVWPYKWLAKYFTDYRITIYQCPSSLLSSDIEATFRNFDLLESAALSDIKRLKSEGVRDFSFYGVSLGSVMAFRTANILAFADGRANGVVVNLSCADFPFAVWNGSATEPIREDWRERGVSYSEIDQAWSYLSPINNLQRLKETKILFFASKKDAVMNSPNVMDLADTLASSFPKAEVYTNVFLGHYLGGAKNFLRLRTMRKFLDKP
ncbi:MAG: thioesterase domain-containing protein [Candidatus Giovannonibacteria bacterium]|nr:thioesterase domain-containing protein [Candidatus Giovannonibacteria bacterium]